MNRLHLDITKGSGRPLVLLHGVYFDHHLWDEVRVSLPGRTIIAIDMPGHGQSPPLAVGASVDDVAMAVADAVRAAGITDAIWVGHSWGGMTLARLAHSHADLVAGAIFSNTPARRTSGLHRIGFVMQQWMLRLGLPATTYGRLAAGSLYDRKILKAHPGWVDEMATRVGAMGRIQVIRTIATVLLDAGDSIELMAATSVPHRVVVGERDYVLTDEVAERFRSCLDVVEGGHVTPRESPTAILAALAALETEVDRSASKTAG